MAKQYLVETAFTPGIWTPILETNNYDRAAATTNFWDERQDTRLIDRYEVYISEDPMDVQQYSWYREAMEAFDRAILRLEVEKEYMPKLRALLSRPRSWIDINFCK